jgi:hypothetical protein
MILICLFIENSQIKDISKTISYKSQETSFKIYRDKDKILYNNKYYEITKEQDSYCTIGIIRILDIEEINPIRFPCKKDYYIETYDGNKQYLGVNTFSIQNKKNLTIISTDLYEFNELFEKQLT